MTTPGEHELHELLERVRADDSVLGLVLLGSRAWGEALDERSDYDVVVVVADDAALARFEAEVPFVRGSPLEVVSDTLAGFRAHAAVGSATEWARAAYVHARVLLDKTGGTLERLVAGKLALPAEIGRMRAREQLDAYVNAYVRSARNRMLGLEAAARLDAAESVAPFLETIFLLEGRVRPFNKHLEWDLRTRPLADDAWRAEELVPRLVRILDGSLVDQQALFRDVERVARSAGLGEVIDGWEPDVAWLRGEGEYHAPR